MPRFAHVEAPVPCPHCGEDLTVRGLVGFQWGYCATPAGGTGFDYRVGEAIDWRLDRGGRIPPWAYFSGWLEGGNMGDPAVGDLLVRESEFDIRACARCGHRFAGIALLIRGGVIREVRAYEDGLPESQISVIEGEGQLVPRPDWEVHAMPVVDGGWWPRFGRWQPIGGTA